MLGIQQRTKYTKHSVAIEHSSRTKQTIQKIKYGNYRVNILEDIVCYGEKQNRKRDREYWQQDDPSRPH